MESVIAERRRDSLPDERFSALTILFTQQIEKERMRNINPLAPGSDENRLSFSFLPQREELNQQKEIIERCSTRGTH
jgi:hypothetical protein